jgi:hypothetical protein
MSIGGMLGYALYVDRITSSKLPQLRMFDCYWCLQNNCMAE